VGGIDGDPCVKETEQSASSAGVPRRSHDREDPMEDPIRGCGKKLCENVGGYVIACWWTWAKELKKRNDNVEWSGYALRAS